MISLKIKLLALSVLASLLHEVLRLLYYREGENGVNETCASGPAKCPPPISLCGFGPDGCVTVQNDNDNCGGCYAKCSTIIDENCVNGKCSK
ncbi:uncharacterized protein CcaverHIS019_0604530 [Cutaneotrichosporon cavernicola]|uniref:Uncharacterized protein n=1 Tax=Cutaneotrichosporon cavernicola TaxID=279322 RepID=A0AA48L8L0_9TREE|nr:uncharacterized protein CcaverHIS019_0604530 [Cutaneotrichosporon cavernicola]BEI93994.1 hypothetical protein CcaverHIS019_0604530 [Cutaneotrichosporon cavernicola]